MNLWITYSVKGGRYHPTDPEPDTYYNVAVFDCEIDALRFANQTGAKAKPITPGETLVETARKGWASGYD